jgi:DNA repair exonuclease SbcCD ATPase subunit
VLTKFEAQKTPDELVTKYSALVTKLDEKIADMDQTTELYSFLKSLCEDLNDRIGELQAQ